MKFNNGQYNFSKDIYTGVKGEVYIRVYLEKLGFVFIDICKDNRYDLKMSYLGKIYTYEIKTDVYPRDTGNLVIEFECRGKNSGINVTQADYFTTYFPHLKEIWNIRCNILKKLIQDTNPHIFSQSGDSGSNTKLYRLKKEEVRQYFKIHKL